MMLLCSRFARLLLGAAGITFLTLNFFLLETAQAQSGAPLLALTKSDYRNSNQSKVFYYDNAWWAVAYQENIGAWFLWKYDGANWIKKTNLQTGVLNAIDVVLDSASAKLYVYFSRISQPRIRRYSYSGGTWVRDAGFPVTLSNFKNADFNNAVPLVKANNGNLWIFRIDSGKLQARYSTDQGLTWQPIINLKTGLNQANGITDAVAFKYNGQNYVGVGYGEKGIAGQPSEFGFLMHKDGDPNTTWTDETSKFSYVASDRGYSEICMAVDASNNIYMLTRTFSGGPTSPRNSLYKRDKNGNWTLFIVNTVASGVKWISPVVAIDGENNKLMVMGTNAASGKSEYKTCRIGEEHLLETAPLMEVFSSGADEFENLSGPAVPMNAAKGFLFAGGNKTTDDLWVNFMPIPANVPVVVQNVSLSHDKVNTNAQYSFTFRTLGCGSLTSGLGKINVRFPDNTLVPFAISTANVLVDGVPATAVAASGNTREIAITTPVPVADVDTVTVTITAAAGLLNASVAGAYALEVWTSSQPKIAISPTFTLLNTTTTVSAVKTSLLPYDADSLAQYKVGFRVGACGRMKSGVSTFQVCFDAHARVTQGVLTGVLVNGVSATAAGDSANDAISVTLPLSLAVNNGDSVTIVIPRAAVRNPKYPKTTGLQAATSVETTKISSNSYYHQRGRGVAGTSKKFDRANQNKLFYYGGAWWMAAQDRNTNRWHLWKRSDTTWTKSTLIYTGGKGRPDCVLDEAGSRAYILLPGASIAYLARLSYAAGNWTVDGGYPKQVNNVQEETMNLARAKNGELWVFWIADSTIYTSRSSDEGNSWSAATVVKAHLNTRIGLTDAVAYAIGGTKYVGVGYAEDNKNNSVFGFLSHQDGAPDGTWVQETVPQFSGTSADIHISMAVHFGEIFMAVKTEGGGGANTTKNGLLHRNVNGVWSAYSVITNNGWTRPTLAIDSTNNMLYLFGSREGALQTVEMKKSVLSTAGYTGLLAAPLDTLMQNGADDFLHVSSPAHVVGGSMGLLVAASNETRNEVWTQFIALTGGGVPKAVAHEELELRMAESSVTENELVVGAYPNPFNPSTQIEFNLQAPAHVKLQIFNLNGQLIKTLVNGPLSRGAHHRTWRGTNQEGKTVATGTYLYRLQVDAKAKTGRLFLLK